MSFILLVDDSQSYRSAIRELLEPLGHQVVESGNGQVAIETCGHARPDLLIIDVLLPEHRGMWPATRFLVQSL